MFIPFIGEILISLTIGSLLATSIIYYHKYHRVLKERDKAARERDEAIREGYIDSLTGVYNRAGFNRIAGEVYSSHKRGSDAETIGIAYIDLDAFKVVNDERGHPFGDEVLVIFGKLLSKTVRETDVIGRRGGDEFVVLFTNEAGRESIHIENLLGRMRKEFEHQVSELYAEHGAEKPCDVSFSYGFAQHHPDNKSSLIDLIALADKALYKHKAKRGRK